MAAAVIPAAADVAVRWSSADVAAEKEEECPAEDAVTVWVPEEAMILSGEEWTDRQSAANVKRRDAAVKAAAVRKKGAAVKAVAVRKKGVAVKAAAVRKRGVAVRAADVSRSAVKAVTVWRGKIPVKAPV